MEKELQKNHPVLYNRSSLVVLDIDGNLQLISRFLKAQNPPCDFKSKSGCAHFVSLIPMFHICEHTDSNEWDICLTNQQSLNCLAGDRFEHALLLANYFLYLNNSKETKYKDEVLLIFGKDIFLSNVVSALYL